jgi:hypothetical protein
MKKRPTDNKFDSLNAFQKQIVLDVLNTLGVIPELLEDYGKGGVVESADKAGSICYLADEAFGNSDCWEDRPDDFQDWLDENGRADVIAGYKESVLQKTLEFLIDQVSNRLK